MKQLNPKFSRGTFIRKVLLMISGTGGAQIIILLASPLITRLYGPEAFGVLGVFMAFAMILIPPAGLGYQHAIVLPKHEEEAVSITKITLISIVLVALISFGISSIFGKELLSLLKFEEIIDYLYFIPIVILFGSLFQVAEQWAVRLQEFGVIAKTKLIHALFIQGGMIGLGLLYPFAIVLIGMYVLGHLLNSILMSLGIVKDKSLNRFLIKKKSPLKMTADKYKDFPMYRAPEMFLNALSQNIPIIFLTSLFGPAAAGFFTLSRRVLLAPSSLIGKSVGDVFYPRITQAYYNGEDLQKLIKKATIGLSLAGAIPYGIVILFGPWVFDFVFGSEWSQAGEYARWMALGAFFGFINKPSVKSLPVLSAQRFQLLFTILMLVVRIGVLIVGAVIFKNDLVAVALFGISGALLNIVLIIITLRISKNFN